MSGKPHNLIAGPFLGELGWELFCWQGRLRRLAKRYDDVCVMCRPGHEVFYRDFAYTGRLPGGLSEGFTLHDLDVIPTNTRLVDYVATWTDEQVEASGFTDQDFIRYGDASAALDSFDVVIHARA